MFTQRIIYYIMTLRDVTLHYDLQRVVTQLKSYKTLWHTYTNTNTYKNKLTVWESRSMKHTANASYYLA